MMRRVMHRVPIEVSRLALGTVQFGMDYGFTKAKSQAEVDAILDACAEEGVDLLDTAPSYGDSETKIGDYLSRRPSSRFTVATKFSRGSAAEMGRSLYASIRALRRRSIDLLQLHDAGPGLAEDGRFWEAVSVLRGRGDFRLFGVSVYEPAEALSLIARRAEQVDFLQVPYNVFDRRFESVAAPAAAARVSLISRSAFLKGVVTAGEVPPQLAGLLPFKRRLEAAARAAGVGPGAAALAFAAGAGWLHSTLVGVDSAAELRENARTVGRVAELAGLRRELEAIEPGDPALFDPRRWAGVR